MVRKALVPVAGLGTRLRPISTVVPKAFLPLVGPGNKLRPVVHWVCAEALSAGIEQIGLVVLPGQEETFRRYFASAAEAGGTDLPAGIEYIPAEPLGFGYAVLRGRQFIAGEPFMVLLGDHVHQAAAGLPSCAGQVLQAFGRHGGSAMIGMQTVGAEELPLVGAARGEPVASDVYRCTRIIEKPSPAVAAKELRSAGLPEGRFLAHCGIYVFSPEIFECLEALRADLPPGKELQLTDAQALLLNRHPGDYYLLRVAGRALDTGTPAGYAAALQTFGKA